LNLHARDRSDRETGHAAERQNGQFVKPAVPVIVLILALTAIPVELRPLDFERIDWGLSLADVVANVVGFIPVGIFLAGLSIWRALALATMLTLTVEASQLIMEHRYSSLIDVIMNVAGAIIGWFFVRWLGIRVPTLRLNPHTACLAAFALLVMLGLRGWSDWDDLSVNRRGAISAGSQEAHWAFDEASKHKVSDSSGNQIDGLLRGGATRNEGRFGSAIRLDGVDDEVDFRSPIQLRLMGSITICAWINSASFPEDDAAIVSAHRPGYQLDTTVDRGLRTIGFKLEDTCGELMARYGATELFRDTWYHVAGVYDAEAKSLHVFLNGQCDDGFLLGQVTSVQQASSQRVCIGTRSDREGYRFSGLIDDVRVFSRPLSAEEIKSVMSGAQTADEPTGVAVRAWPVEIRNQRLSENESNCHQPTRQLDAIVPGLLVATGMFSAVACAGFWPGNKLAALAVSLMMGMLLLPYAAITLPAHVRWMLPVLCLFGGATIALSAVDSH
jgi:hypothetical protein